MAKMKGAIVVDTERCKGESARLSVCGGYERGGLRRLCFVRHCLPRWLYHRVS